MRDLIVHLNGTEGRRREAGRTSSGSRLSRRLSTRWKSSAVVLMGVTQAPVGQDRGVGAGEAGLVGAIVMSVGGDHVGVMVVVVLLLMWHVCGGVEVRRHHGHRRRRGH